MQTLYECGIITVRETEANELLWTGSVRLELQLLSKHTAEQDGSQPAAARSLKAVPVGGCGRLHGPLWSLALAAGTKNCQLRPVALVGALAELNEGGGVSRQVPLIRSREG